MRPDELSGLLQRASEISTETEDILASDPELALIAHAAEEAGLPREAILAALRERLAERGNLVRAGEIVLAVPLIHDKRAAAQNVAHKFHGLGDAGGLELH